MTETEIMSFLSKLNAEMNAISLVVSELLAAECLTRRDPTEHLRIIAKHVQNFLDEMDFGPEWSAEARHMTAWARHRAELIVLRAQDGLARGL